MVYKLQVFEVCPQFEVPASAQGLLGVPNPQTLNPKLNQVRSRFQHQPHVYSEFLNIMRGFKVNCVVICVVSSVVNSVVNSLVNSVVNSLVSSVVNSIVVVCEHTHTHMY